MDKKVSIMISMVAILTLGSLIVSFNDVIVRLLSSKGNIFQYLLARQLMMTAFIVPFWLRQSKSKRSQGMPWVQISRAHLLILGSGGVFIALKYMSLATANAVFYTAPIFTIVFATLFFKDKIRIYQMATASIAFVGMLLTVKPDGISWAIIAALVTAVTLALSNLLPRVLKHDTTNLSIMFWNNFYTLPTLVVLGLIFWEPISSDFLLFCLASCICSIAYQYSTVIAYRRVNASIIAIIEYSGLVFVALLGWLFFDEKLDSVAIFGIVLIIVPMVFQSYLDKKKLSEEDIVSGLPVSVTT